MVGKNPLETAVVRTKIILPHLLSHPYWETNNKEFSANPELFHKLALVSLHYLWKTDLTGYQRSIAVLTEYFSLRQVRFANSRFPYSKSLDGLRKQIERDALYNDDDLKELTEHYISFLATNFTYLVYDPLLLQIVARTEQGGRKKQYDDYLILEFPDGVLVAVLDGVGKNPLSRIIVDHILKGIRDIKQLSLQNVQDALRIIQNEIIKNKELNERGGGSTIVLFIYLHSGEVYSITIGDSWYITVDNNGLHRSTPHAIDGRITEAIGNRSTSTKPISSFTKRHLAIPDATFLASDGFNQIERFSPKLIHTILRDTSIPTVLKMAMIATLSSLVFGINGDNSTSILVTLVPDEEPTETLK